MNQAQGFLFSEKDQVPPFSSADTASQTWPLDMLLQGLIMVSFETVQPTSMLLKLRILLPLTSRLSLETIPYLSLSLPNMER